MSFSLYGCLQPSSIGLHDRERFGAGIEILVVVDARKSGEKELRVDIHRDVDDLDAKLHELGITCQPMEEGEEYGLGNVSGIQGGTYPVQDQGNWISCHDKRICFGSVSAAITHAIGSTALALPTGAYLTELYVHGKDWQDTHTGNLVVGDLAPDWISASWERFAFEAVFGWRQPQIAPPNALSQRNLGYPASVHSGDEAFGEVVHPTVAPVVRDVHQQATLGSSALLKVDLGGGGSPLLMREGHGEAKYRSLCSALRSVLPSRVPFAVVCLGANPGTLTRSFTAAGSPVFEVDKNTWRGSVPIWGSGVAGMVVELPDQPQGWDWLHNHKPYTIWRQALPADTRLVLVSDVSNDWGTAEADTAFNAAWAQSGLSIFDLCVARFRSAPRAEGTYHVLNTYGHNPGGSECFVVVEPVSGVSRPVSSWCPEGWGINGGKVVLSGDEVQLAAGAVARVSLNCQPDSSWRVLWRPGERYAHHVAKYAQWRGYLPPVETGLARPPSPHEVQLAPGWVLLQDLGAWYGMLGVRTSVDAQQQLVSPEALSIRSQRSTATVANDLTEYWRRIGFASSELAGRVERAQIGASAAGSEVVCRTESTDGVIRARLEHVMGYAAAHTRHADGENTIQQFFLGSADRGVLLANLSALRVVEGDTCALERCARPLPISNVVCLAFDPLFTLLCRFLDLRMRLGSLPLMHAWEIQSLLHRLTYQGSLREKYAYLVTQIRSLSHPPGGRAVSSVRGNAHSIAMDCIKALGGDGMSELQVVDPVLAGRLKDHAGGAYDRALGGGVSGSSRASGSVASSFGGGSRPANVRRDSSRALDALSEHPPIREGLPDEPPPARTPKTKGSRNFQSQRIRHPGPVPAPSGGQFSDSVRQQGVSVRGHAQPGFTPSGLPGPTKRG